MDAVHRWIPGRALSRLEKLYNRFVDGRVREKIYVYIRRRTRTKPIEKYRLDSPSRRMAIGRRVRIRGCEPRGVGYFKGKVLVAGKDWRLRRGAVWSVSLRTGDIERLYVSPAKTPLRTVSPTSEGTCVISGYSEAVVTEDGEEFEPIKGLRGVSTWSITELDGEIYLGEYGPRQRIFRSVDGGHSAEAVIALSDVLPDDHIHTILAIPPHDVFIVNQGDHPVRTLLTDRHFRKLRVIDGSSLTGAIFYPPDRAFFGLDGPVAGIAVYRIVKAQRGDVGIRRELIAICPYRGRVDMIFSVCSLPDGRIATGSLDGFLGYSDDGLHFHFAPLTSFSISQVAPGPSALYVACCLRDGGSGALFEIPSSALTWKSERYLWWLPMEADAPEEGVLVPGVWKGKLLVKELDLKNAPRERR